MIPGLGAYYRPDRLEEALALLAAEPAARVLAGGTDLLLQTEPVGSVVDITRLGLDAVQVRDGDLVLGSTLRIEALRHDGNVRAWADGVLVGACLHFGTLQVRHMATLGGNIAHALPAADLVPALLVLDARLRLARAGEQGGIVERTVPLDGFTSAPGQTELQPGEVILDVRLPAATRPWRAQFRKIGRILKDLSQVNCAVSLDLHARHVRQARIAAGAVHPTVCRVVEAEQMLQGADLDGPDWRRRVDGAVQALRRRIRPISDMRASAAWRRHVCGVLVQRCLQDVTDPRLAGHVPCYEDGPQSRMGVPARGSP